MGHATRRSPLVRPHPSPIVRASVSQGVTIHRHTLSAHVIRGDRVRPHIPTQTHAVAGTMLTAYVAWSTSTRDSEWRCHVGSTRRWRGPDARPLCRPGGRPGTGSLAAEDFSTRVPRSLTTSGPVRDCAMPVSTRLWRLWQWRPRRRAGARVFAPAERATPGSKGGDRDPTVVSLLFVTRLATAALRRGSL